LNVRGYLKKWSNFRGLVKSSLLKSIYKLKGETSQNPPELPAVLKYTPNLQKLSIYTLELSIVLNLDPFVQTRAQNFFKRPNYP
jgi:hypothetical protein